MSSAHFDADAKLRAPELENSILQEPTRGTSRNRTLMVACDVVNKGGFLRKGRDRSRKRKWLCAREKMGPKVKQEKKGFGGKRTC